MDFTYKYLAPWTLEKMKILGAVLEFSLVSRKFLAMRNIALYSVRNKARLETNQKS